MAPPFPSRVALASATSDNGTARNGAAVNSFEVAAGVLVADLSVTIVTGSVVCTSAAGQRRRRHDLGGHQAHEQRRVRDHHGDRNAGAGVPARRAFQQLRIVMTLSAPRRLRAISPRPPTASSPRASSRADARA